MWLTLKQAAVKKKTLEVAKKKTEYFRGQKCRNNIGKNEKCRESKRASETKNKNRKMVVQSHLIASHVVEASAFNNGCKPVSIQKKLLTVL